MQEMEIEEERLRKRSVGAHASPASRDFFHRVDVYVGDTLSPALFIVKKQRCRFDLTRQSLRDWKLLIAAGSSSNTSNTIVSRVTASRSAMRRGRCSSFRSPFC